ncbi:MAG: HNH endonuclease signature motif containing protein [Oligoflexia bacterium]|nr:HNH endonuclease signature motif containing protein [Oligoflexia bacterium]
MIHETQIRNLRKLSSKDLVLEAKSSVKAETAKTLWILHVLREIERRRAFAEEAYPSLIEFCVGELKYSRGAAYRRINAMRLLKDHPELEDKLANGIFELSALASAQSYFYAEAKESQPLSHNAKCEILGVLETKSTIEAQIYLNQLSPRPLMKERIKQITEDISEMRLPMPKRVKDKIDRFKDLLSYKNNNLKTIDVIEEALDRAISQLEKQERKLNNQLEKQDQMLNNQCEPQSKILEQKKCPLADTVRSTQAVLRSTRRQVFHRDANRCSYIYPTTMKRCASRSRLEVDHIAPRALGGSNDLSNLRLLCRVHNIHAAVTVFGLGHMDKFIN